MHVADVHARVDILVAGSPYTIIAHQPMRAQGRSSDGFRLHSVGCSPTVCLTVKSPLDEALQVCRSNSGGFGMAEVLLEYGDLFGGQTDGSM